MSNKIEQERKCEMCEQMFSIREFFVFKKGVRTKGGGTVRKEYKQCRKCRAVLNSRKWRKRNKLKKRFYNRYYWNYVDKNNPNRKTEKKK